MAPTRRHSPVGFLLGGSLDEGGGVRRLDADGQSVRRNALGVEHVGAAVHVDDALRHGAHLQRETHTG